MAEGRLSEQSCPKYKVVRQEFTHVTDPYQLEVAPIQSKNVVTSRPEYCALSELGPSNQILEPTSMVEVADQVYKIVLRKEVRHSLAPRALRLIEVHVQFPKYNGVLEIFQGLLQVRQVLKR